jgi:cysteine-rich repeat protein
MFSNNKFQLLRLTFVLLFTPAYFSCNSSSDSPDDSESTEGSPSESEHETESTDVSTESETESETQPTGPVCGNCKREYGEECDDCSDAGEADAGTGKWCSSECMWVDCGNERVDPGEECDDGSNGNNNDGCDDYCKEIVCGNGRVDTGEECDDAIDDNCVDCKTIKTDGCGTCPQEVCVYDADPTNPMIHPMTSYYDLCYDGEEGELCGAVVDCLEVTGCASPELATDPSEDVASLILTSCFCGMENNYASCMTNGPNGLCAEEIVAAAHTSDLLEIYDILTDNTLPIGRAMDLLKCMDDQCTSCLYGTCGNGEMDDLEECDDGNTTNGDGCSSRCELVSDTDSDTGADTESDFDSDTDLDGGPDADTDTDSDVDIDADSDVDTDTDVDSDTDTDADSDSDDEACLQCETDQCTYWDMNYDEILDPIMDDCLNGPTGDLCSALLICIQNTGCAAEQASDCYCGTASPALCMLGYGDGACMAEMETATETTDPMTLAERYFDPAYASGDAMAMVDCERQNCTMCLEK